MVGTWPCSQPDQPTHCIRRCPDQKPWSQPSPHHPPTKLLFSLPTVIKSTYMPLWHPFILDISTTPSLTQAAFVSLWTPEEPSWLASLHPHLPLLLRFQQNSYGERFTTQIWSIPSNGLRIKTKVISGAYRTHMSGHHLLLQLLIQNVPSGLWAAAPGLSPTVASSLLLLMRRLHLAQCYPSSSLS